MKKSYSIFAPAKKKNIAAAALIAVAAFFVSCGGDDPASNVTLLPTANSFNALRDAAIESRTQHFDFQADGTIVTLTSAKGVTIRINTSCLQLNGNTASGNVDLEFMEVFSRGEMAVTNKTTRGITETGTRAMLVSGGEFFVSAYQNGQRLDLTCAVSLDVPTQLSGGLDTEMTLWRELETDTLTTADVTWTAVDPENTQDPQGNALFWEGDTYYIYFDAFGWTNCDRFYSFTGPKTAILVDVPEGYDNTNSAVYLSYDGEGNALANLDTYTTEGLFSEHYGEVPVGLACHVIFISESDGSYRYAIKPVTVAENEIISIALSETTTGTETQLIGAIQDAQD